MQVIELERNMDDLPNRKTFPVDPGMGLVSDAKIVDASTGKAVLIVGKLPARDETAALREALHTIKWQDTSKAQTSGSRLAGFSNANTVFGYADAKPLRRRYGCSRARLTVDHPAADGLLDWHSQYMAGLFKEHLPEEYERQLELLGSVGEPWKLPGGVWTSGIVNETAALPYHKDSGNILTAWSTMIVLRRFVSGGNLHIPEYNVTLDCDDGMFMFFDGGKVLHGVTPMWSRRVPNGSMKAYRRSIVWYARQGMTKCAETLEEEIAQARTRRSLSEVGQAGDLDV